MAFVQREVPQLNLVCTLTQNNKQTNMDFCPHLIASAQAPDTSDILYVAYVAKVGFVCVVVLQMGCIMSKNTIEIQYSYNWRISSLNMHVVKEEEEDSKLSKGVYLFIGYEDGSISMHMLIQGGNRPLARIFKIKPKMKKKQLIIRALVWGTNLVLSTAYSIFVYHRMFLKQDIRIKQQPKSPAKSPAKSPGKSPSKVTEPKKAEDSLVKQQQIKIDINQCKINIQINFKSDLVYIFNQLQGAVCFNLNTFTQVMKIQDSIKILCVCEKLTPNKSHIVVIGGTDDSIKFIDYDFNIVEKFIGFKNYPSCFEEDPLNQILWVGCLDGTISCFSYKKKIIEKKKTFIMHENRLMFSVKVNENGIKKIIVHKQILIIFDCCHNIEFYDIVMSTMTTDRYASSNQEAQSSGQEVEEVRIGKR